MARLSDSNAALKQIEDIHSKISELYEAVDAIKIIRGKSDASYGMLQDYESQIKTKASEIETLESIFADVVKKTNARKDQFEKETQRILAEVDDEKTRIAESLNALESEKQDIEALRTVLDKEIRGFYDNITKQTNRFNEKLEKHLQVSGQQIDSAIESGNSALSEALKKVSDFIDASNDHLQRMKNEIEVFRNRTQHHIQTKLEELNRQQGTWQETVTQSLTLEMKNEFATQTKQIETLDSNIRQTLDQKSQDIIKHQNEFQTACNKDISKRLNLKAEQHQKIIDETLSQLKDSIDHEKAEIRNALTLLQQETENTQSIRESLNTELADFHQKLSERIQTFHEQYTNLERQSQEKIETHTRELEDFKNRIQTHVSEASDQLTQNIDEKLAQWVSEFDSIKKQTQDDLKLISTEREKIRDAQNAFESEMTAYQSNLSNQLTQKTDEKLLIFTTEFDSLKNQIKNALKLMTAEREKIKETRVTLESETSAFQSNLSDRWNQFSTQFEELQSNLSESQLSMHENLSKKFDDESEQLKKNIHETFRPLRNEFHAEKVELRNTLNRLQEKEKEVQALHDSLNLERSNFRKEFSDQSQTLHEGFMSLSDRQQELTQTIASESKQKTSELEALKINIQDELDQVRTERDETHRLRESLEAQAVGFQSDFTEQMNRFDHYVEKTGEKLESQVTSCIEKQEKRLAEQSDQLSQFMNIVKSNIKKFKSQLKSSQDELIRDVQTHRDKLEDAYTTSLNQQQNLESLEKEMRAFMDETDRQTQKKNADASDFLKNMVNQALSNIHQGMDKQGQVTTKRLAELSEKWAEEIREMKENHESRWQDARQELDMEKEKWNVSIGEMNDRLTEQLNQMTERFPLKISEIEQDAQNRITETLSHFQGQFDAYKEQARHEANQMLNEFLQQEQGSISNSILEYMERRLSDEAEQMTKQTGDGLKATIVELFQNQDVLIGNIMQRLDGFERHLSEIRQEKNIAAEEQKKKDAKLSDFLKQIAKIQHIQTQKIIPDMEKRLKQMENGG